MGDLNRRNGLGLSITPTVPTGRERPQAPETGTGAGDAKRRA